MLVKLAWTLRSLSQMTAVKQMNILGCFLQVSTQVFNRPLPTNVQQTPDGDFYADPIYNYAYEVLRATDVCIGYISNENES
jgi:hypothetical protein